VVTGQSYVTIAVMTYHSYTLEASIEEIRITSKQFYGEDRMSLEIYKCKNCHNVFVEPVSGIPRCPQCGDISLLWEGFE
jgi:predicted Zn-ribbon and HTH transcriptional regulator